MRRLLDACIVNQVERSLVLIVIIGVLAAAAELTGILVVVILLVVALCGSSPVANLAETVALAERLIRHVLESIGQLAWSPALHEKF